MNAIYERLPFQLWVALETAKRALSANQVWIQQWADGGINRCVFARSESGESRAVRFLQNGNAIDGTWDGLKFIAD
jgi:hypothetical protein